MTRTGRMKVGWGAASDVGTVRAVNEDSILTGPSVFAVADGMGGHAAGDVASRIAVEHLASLDGQHPLHADDLIAALSTANDKIVATGAASPATAGMGTTVSGIAIVDAGGTEHWMVFNVGDSRTYRLADGTLEQVTVDHSEVQELVAAGQLSLIDARTYPRRNVVTRSLGSEAMPPVDHWLFPVRGGELFLICSDGLVNEIDDSGIADLLSGDGDAAAMADALVSAAVAAGARDNVSVVLVGVSDAETSEVDEDTAPRTDLPEMNT